MSISTYRRVVPAVVIAWLILALPANPAAFQLYPLLRVPLEIFLLLLAGSILRCRAFFAIRLLSSLLLVLILFLKLADIGTGVAFQRPFNPYLDTKLFADGWNLLSGSVGRMEAAAYMVTALLLLLTVGLLFFWSFGALETFSRKARHRVSIFAAVSLAASSAALALFPGTVPLSMDAGYSLANRVSLIRQSIADLAAFEKDLETDPIDGIPESRLLASLTGTDVVIIFVESYGRDVIEDERYAERTATRLRQVERQISEAGLHIRSGWLTSPTIGGLSWLAHGTLLSGLWTDSQARYDRMIASRRKTLNRLFRERGWRTTAIMPAITMAWPESGYFGYDSVHDAAGLGYRGKPFNWVTMPDQYTLASFERLERTHGDDPIMAEIALISSHAPWTPVPQLIDWDQVGDGRAFDAQAQTGDPPSVVWSDPESIRQQYQASIDYVL
ncbi:MAG TPA: sulfatase, partial [Pseudorhizobium sp.]|nr:sulfatase [Pseudorhizobium sp.]